jgi:chloride channel protein, CIC family
MNSERHGIYFWNPRNLPEWLRLRFPETQRYVIIWTLAGLACGLAAVLYHEAISWLFRWVEALSGKLGGTWAMVVLVAAPTLGGLISGLVCAKIEPTAAGGGVTQIKARFSLNFGVFRLREAVWRFIASALTVGSGMAMGPEGPTIHFCGAIASWIGQKFGLAKRRIQSMVPVGVGAGLSAAFNTPLAGMFFVFEEFFGEFSSRAIFGILIAVVISAIVERTLVGEHALFTLGLPSFSTDWWMLLCIPIGIICAAVGTAFVRLILGLRLKAKANKTIPTWLRPAIAGLLIGLVGVTILKFTGHDGVFSVGYGDLAKVMNGKMIIPATLALLLIGKFFSYIIASTANTSGGIFAPVLFIGGMLGALCGTVTQMAGLGINDHVVGALALIGMGCMFASVIRCPMTSFMIVFEMTRNYSIMLPLMAGDIIAYMLSVRWHPLSLYDSMLLQDKISLKRMPSLQGEKDWHNLPVKTIMTFDVVTVRSSLDAVKNLEWIHENARSHHAYPVIAADGGLVGCVTHDELEKLVKSCAGTPLEKLVEEMRAPVTVSSETSISDTARILVREDVLQAPVVSPSDKKRLLGIVTLHDIARQQNAVDANDDD